MKKTPWKMGTILLGTRMSLVLLAMLLFAGLTSCDQADKVIDDAAETAKQTVNTAKEKVTGILGTAEDKDSEEDSEKESTEKDESEEKHKD